METLGLVLLTVLAVGYYGMRILMKRREKRVVERPEFEDLNDKFIRNASQKIGTADIAKVSQADTLALLRALLDAEGIESYVIESRFGGLYPLTSLPGFTETVVTVYEADREAARAVVEDLLTEPGNTGRLERL